MMHTGARVLSLAIGLVLSGSPSLAAEVIVAVVGPMTGKFAALGAQMKLGANLAVAEVNRTGGVRKLTVTLVSADDRCDPALAVTTAKSLARRKVGLVVGHLCSQASIAAAPIYARAGILMISPGSTDPRLTDIARRNGWRNIFRVCGRDDTQGIVVGKYLSTRYRRRRIAILHDHSAYGRGLARIVRRTIRGRGVREVVYQGYSADAANFVSLVRKLKASKIEAVFLGGYYPEGGMIVREAHKVGFQPQFIAGDSFVTSEFWKATGNAGGGILVTAQRDPRQKPQALSVIKKAQRSGKTLNYYGLNTHAAIQVWALAARSAGSLRVAALSRRLRLGRFATAIGTLQFNGNGDVRNSRYVWYVWRRGRTVPR